MAALAAIVTEMTERSSLSDGVKRLRLVAVFAEIFGTNVQTCPQKVSGSPFCPKGYECSLIVDKRLMDVAPTASGMEPREGHRNLHVRHVLHQLAASVQTPRSPVAEAAVPVPHIEMKGNGTPHMPARTTEAHGDRTEKRPPVLEPLCNRPFHRLSRPQAHQLSRSLSPSNQLCSMLRRWAPVLRGMAGKL